MWRVSRIAAWCACAGAIACSDGENEEVFRYEDVRFTESPGKVGNFDRIPSEYASALRVFLGKWEGRPIWKEDGRPVASANNYRYEINIGLIRAELRIKWTKIWQPGGGATESEVREILIHVFSSTQDTIDFLDLKGDVFPKMTSVTVATIRHVAQDTLELEEHLVTLTEPESPPKGWQRDKWWVTTLTRRE